MLFGLKLLMICAVTVLAALLVILLGPFDHYGKSAYGITRLWTRLILTIGGVAVRVNGLSQINPKQQYVFMVNHQSNIDAVLLKRLFPTLGETVLLWVPFFGWAMRAAKHITVDRSGRFDALGSLKKAQERMKDGISLVVFPEGTRSSDGNLLPFKRGGFLLAAKSQTPIVPVTITGSGAILPKGVWRIRGGKIEVWLARRCPPIIDRGLCAAFRHVQELIEKTLKQCLNSERPSKRTIYDGGVYGEDSSLT
jgi:1-acyl-sn-glycerol-3-phosphate acyltransferase